LPLYHFDAYRVKNDDEFRELGPEEYFQAGGLTFVEWADRVEQCLPRERFTISIEVDQAERRRFLFAAEWPGGADVVASVGKRLS
jgi:tRNA threonylcarbamoyladenosine biosynthesis protein TsaE